MLSSTTNSLRLLQIYNYYKMSILTIETIKILNRFASNVAINDLLQVLVH